MPSSSNQPRSARIASFLKNRRDGRPGAEDTIERRTHSAPVEVSQEQQRIWLHCALSGCSETYNDIFSLRYTGNLNISALENAVNEIVKRHEAWRTSFEMVDNKVVQKVTADLKLALPFSDVRNLRVKQREIRVSELTAQDAKQTLILTEAPLLRARLIRVADDDFRLTLVIHHLISDGVSVFQVFLSELQILYSAFVQGLKPNLPPLPFQYSDYAEWQRRTAAARNIDADLKFWDQQLKGELPVTNLLDRPRPSSRSFDGGVEMFQLKAELSEGLKRTADSFGATVFMVAVSAFHVLLYHYTGECDQIFGCVTSTRKQFGTDALLGVFVNMLPIRSRFSSDDLFPALVRQVRETMLSALEHELPFDVLVRRFGRRVPGIAPFFQVVFVLEPSPASVSGGWHLEDRSGDSPFAKWDLSLFLQEDRGHLWGRFSYCRDIFNPETISSMRNAFLTLLGELASDPDRSLYQLSTCLAAKRDKGVSFGPKWFQKYFSRPEGPFGR